MGTAIENEMILRLRPPIFRQVIAFVFGLIFAVTNGYSGLQLVGAIFCAPLIFAGAVRLYIGVYRLARSLILVGWLAAVIGFCGVGIVTSFVLVPAFQHSAAMGATITVVLMLCEVFVFIRDLKIWKKTYKA